MRCRFSSTLQVTDARGNARVTTSQISPAVGLNAVTLYAVLVSRSRGDRRKLQQRIDRVGHRHERNARVRPDEARIRLASWRPNESSPTRSRTCRRTAASPRKSDLETARTGNRHDRSADRPRAACSAERSSARGARSTACCSRTSSSGCSTRLRERGSCAVSRRGQEARTLRSMTDRGR